MLKLKDAWLTITGYIEFERFLIWTNKKATPAINAVQINPDSGKKHMLPLMLTRP